ncbi:ribbon-helix-helix protein, CopG family [Geobacter sp. SVR]|uniref:ribbon-helix-helix protein, CopG family n=1 Tax=Geobacter sp. SVR TaxID=2495594 RepID=UPI00143EF614|nr:ribbon-helix-helix protein, CopG family [Geobacter sp. SVR]BCS56034.1 hypothetical protein GSVR_43420 [Geobacter sp. SVR]GCF84797.1 hypothetical protein GSbR_13970 [Geobacter sp. SVR]
MGSLKAHPRYHVVSLRISDEERAALDAFARRTSRSVSSVMREAMGICLDSRWKSLIKPD